MQSMDVVATHLRDKHVKTPAPSNVTRETTQWLEALAANGAFVIAPDGSASLSPAAAAAIEALHIVLAGGEVQFNVTVPADATRLDVLNRKLQKALDSVSTPPGVIATFSP